MSIENDSKTTDRLFEDEATTTDRLVVQERRLEVERKLQRLRNSMDREVGWMPKAPYLLLALTAGAVGLSLALKRGSKIKSLESGREETESTKAKRRRRKR